MVVLSRPAISAPGAVEQDRCFTNLPDKFTSLLPRRIPFGSTLNFMRRVWATVLLALFSFPLISPALRATGATLPACCRRGGEHRCVMSHGADQSDSGTRVQTARCPSFPVVKGLPASRTAAAPAATLPGIFIGLAVHSATRPQPKSQYRISYSQSQQKRGPPSFS